ncbi:MAG: TRAP transporter substrate-binding protein [Opitutus sp.]|nr:TRAP transporter substrate-binding protein [Opitutus sp.]
MKQSPFKVLAALLAGGALACLVPACSSNQTIMLRGASQFDESHVYTRTLRKFEELVKQYYGKPVTFELYLNSELGLEKDFFAFMSQGISVDYALVSPSHMSTFSKAAPLMDMPFLFRDLAHWNKVLDGDALKPVADEVAKKADVMLIGFAGGGTRNLIVNKPVTNLAELRGLAIRVMGAPIQTRIFQALHAAPTVIAYNEIYNAVQTGVIAAAENEAAGIAQMKFYEVGPEISLTQHAITVRPVCISGKTFRRLPEDLQAAIIRAGREAGAWGRQAESTEDAAVLARLKSEGKLRTHPFTQRDELMRLAEPVKAAYAKEIDAVDVYARINAVK